MELGGHIELVDFHEVDDAEMIVLKKIIGNHARKYADLLGDRYEKLILVLKKIHGANSNRFELHGKLMTAGKMYTAQCAEPNLFSCVGEVLKKLEAQIAK